MADVWRAHDDRLDRDVAIKFLRSHLTTEPEFLVRFFAEAQSVARINDPHVVSILDFGSFEEAPYLVMELVEGGALDEVTGSPLAVDRALELVEQASLGAGAAHELGLVHRDIKPANILLDTDGRAKLTDFGIASSRGQETLTATGTAIGSPHYISNEQVAGGPPTPRSDVYSLGVVLYELLTTVRPFDGDNVTAIAIAHVDQMPDAPSTHNPDLDPALDALVLRCMSKDPAERFENGTALAREIERIRSGSTGSIPVPLPDVLDDEEFVEPADDEPRTRMFVGAAMVVLLLAAGVAVLLGGRADEPRAAATIPDPASTNTPKERRSPKAEPTVEAAPVVDTQPPSPSPEPTEPEQEATEEEDDESGPSGTFSGGTDPEPDQPAEEPTEEPSAEPTPETTPAPESTPQDQSDGEEVPGG
jgi:serine/threonine protein kinase